jgi:4-amino-4-deoxy-L-arabinose transferase-like glycosyltransferase
VRGRRRVAEAGAVIVAAALGVAIVLVATSRYGPGVTPDSINYEAAARSLVAGTGLQRFDGTPFVHWPPLYPLLLAAFVRVGLDPLTGARILNALVFGGLVLVFARSFRDYQNERSLWLAGTGWMVLSRPLLFVSIMAWSEPLFVLFTVLGVLALIRYLKDPRRATLLWAAVVAALACLTRYMGIALVLAGVILMMGRARSVSRKIALGHAASFGVLPILPLAAWLFRNYSLTSTLAGERAASVTGLGESLAQAADILSRWFYWHKFSAAGTLTIVALLLAAVGFAWRAGGGRARRRVSARRTDVLPWVVFALVYLGLLLLLSATVTIDRISDRLLSPVYVPALLLLVLALGFAAAGLREAPFGSAVSRAVLRYGLLGVCALYLYYPVGQVAEDVALWRREGAGGFNTVEWRESPTMRRAKNLPLDGTRIYSNAPDAVFFLTGRKTERTPTRGTRIEALQDTLSSEGVVYLVWFNAMKRPFLTDLDELVRELPATRIAALEDGAIFRIGP